MSTRGCARVAVPAHLKSWDVNYPDYAPPVCSLDFSGKPWADPDIGTPGFNPQWNTLDGKLNRSSHEGPYRILNGYPLNPKGRTGMAARWKLGRWGPNHAVDAIVSRWLRNSNGERVLNEDTNRPLLQFVSIQRQDTKAWAMPGGMVDAGESVEDAVIREFSEEAMASLELSDDECSKVTEQIGEFFKSSGVEVYRGYVDDYRNTDNAWIETVAFNVHDETGEKTSKWNFKAGDDAVGVRWITVDSNLHLHANHLFIVKEAVYSLQAHF